MNKKNFSLAVFAVLIISTISIYMINQKNAALDIQNAAYYEMYCGSCHELPRLNNIPKSIWKNKVLPEMANRMNNNRVAYNLSDDPIGKASNFQPNTALQGNSSFDSVKWLQIEDYIIKKAPKRVLNLPDRKGRNAQLKRFSTLSDSSSQNDIIGGIVNTMFYNPTKQLFISNSYGNVFEWGQSPPTNRRFNSPVISTIIKDDNLYITEIGIMNPSELKFGKIYRQHSDTMDVLFEKLHRPVYSEVVDLNEDGKNEILICEFGFYTGELSMLVENGSSYEKRTLLPFPGSIKVEIRDMDNDGKKDIVALFSQGREGIYIFYQKDDLKFGIDHVIKMGPEYGSSWFEMVDFDKDGDLDIVLANGDNADYSYFLKPYHGVRLFMNNGENSFKQEWFYPINGATRVEVDDFDLDGDFDIAVSSFFPDYEHCPEEGFVYLENVDESKFIFEPYGTPHAAQGNWLVMEKGDFDQDGDVDIILGGNSIIVPVEYRESMSMNTMYLNNNTIP